MSGVLRYSQQMHRDEIALVHSNPVLIEHGVLRVDRKFHLGMLNFVEQLKLPCCTMNPAGQFGQLIMDQIEVPMASLPYRVQAITLDHGGNPDAPGMQKMRAQIGRSRLVYGTGMASFELSRELGRTFVSIQEYDLQTRITATASQVDNPLRRLIRSVRCVRNYRRKVLPEIEGADAVHCNGYPIYDVAARHNANALLYLDSRMAGSDVIDEAQLQQRIASLPGRRLRLLYSGRYERMKGATDAVRVGVECLRRGMDVEMHFFGQGSLLDQMKKIAGTAPDPSRLVIHPAVPYPDLVQMSRQFDLFVCCHVQNDPSCTYLESMGAGLPIVGYANRMWEQLRTSSRVGYSSPMHRPAKVADDVARLYQNRSELASMSLLAASFARSHCFEREFRKRVDAINAML